MKKVLLLSAATLAFGFASAQDFKITKHEVSASTAGTTAQAPIVWDDEAVVLKSYVKNLTNTEINGLSIQIISQQIPIGWFMYTFCFGSSGACITQSNIQGQVVANAGDFGALGANDSAAFYPTIAVRATDDDGIATVKVRVFNATHSDTATMVLTKSGVNINAVQMDDNRVSVFPNPSSGQASIYVSPELSAKQVVVYNLLGAEVLKMAIVGDVTPINSESIAKGNYLVKVLDKSGNAIATRKLTNK